MLLSDPTFARLCRDELVPVWKTVREVPRVTIDFGGGRKIERTLKGNTAFYLCTADRRIVDIYPGVYTPGDMLAILRPSLQLVRGGKLADAVHARHKQIARLRLALGKLSRSARLSTSKMAVEAPVLRKKPIRVNRSKERAEAPVAEKKQALNRGKTIAEAAILPKKPLNPGKRAAEAPVVDEKAQRQVFEPRRAQGPKQRLNRGKRDVEAPVLDGRRARRPEQPLRRSDALLKAFREGASKLTDGSVIPTSTVALARARSAAERAATPEERGRLVVIADSRQNRTLLRPLVTLLLGSYDRAPRMEDVHREVWVELMELPIDDPWLGLKDTIVPGSE